MKGGKRGDDEGGPVVGKFRVFRVESMMALSLGAAKSKKVETKPRRQEAFWGRSKG